MSQTAVLGGEAGVLARAACWPTSARPPTSATVAFRGAVIRWRTSRSPWAKDDIIPFTILTSTRPSFFPGPLLLASSVIDRRWQRTRTTTSLWTLGAPSERRYKSGSTGVPCRDADSGFLHRTRRTPARSNRAVVRVREETCHLCTRRPAAPWTSYRVRRLQPGSVVRDNLSAGRWQVRAAIGCSRTAATP